MDSMAAMSANDRRRAANETLIAALASGATQEEAAAVAGVTARTVRRRLGQPEFAERVRAERSVLVTRTAGRLIGLADVAVEALGDLLRPEISDSIRLRAALGLLDAARVWREAGEVEERLALLEAAVAAGVQGRAA
jgi:hypothetical protein